MLILTAMIVIAILAAAAAAATISAAGTAVISSPVATVTAVICITFVADGDGSRSTARCRKPKIAQDFASCGIHNNFAIHTTAHSRYPGAAKPSCFNFDILKSLRAQLG